MEEEKLIRGFRSAILIPIWAFAFSGLADACLALEQLAVPRTGTGSIAAPGTPKSGAGARGQLGITNKGGGSIGPDERQHMSDCAATVPASNRADCAPAKAAKGIAAPGGSEVGPAPRRRASPCIGSPDRQCL
jgi:hypothetical protein